MMYLKIMRPQQWYKNIVIFTAIVFTGQFFVTTQLWHTFLGFISLCLISSANYIINDIRDRKADQKHPEKKKRMIASGKVSIPVALLIALLLASAAMYLAFTLALQFALVVAGIFALTQVYTFWLKREQFLDIILIGVLFVMRAASGAFILDVVISPWLILCAFCLSVFMVSGKRRADVHCKLYCQGVLDKVTTVLLAVLLMSYSLYTFIKGQAGLMLTIPIVLYGLLRYTQMIEDKSPCARRPELIFIDARMNLAIFIWGLTVFAAIYLIR